MKKSHSKKPNLLVSFSGGETSAYMTWWIWNNWRDRYNVKVVFANTGDENEETLLFTHIFSQHFNIPVAWVEAHVNPVKRKGTKFSGITFETASRNGEPFEEVIKKYGIPNQNSPHCTRELKQRPIESYAAFIFKGDSYFTAIGIRCDEIDRMNAKRKEKQILYPLIKDRPMTKPKINFWWSQQPFRLKLKGYQGNCKTCWKKSTNKLYQIAKESPASFDVFERLEANYSMYTPESRIQLLNARCETPSTPWLFFRGNKSVYDIKEESSQWKGLVVDDSVTSEIQLEFDFEIEACEVFSECGIDN